MDRHCERVGPGFWAEPFNALTNAAFLIAAATILVRQHRAGRVDKQVFVLALLTASAGIGSFLFDTLGNRWSLVADIVPIAAVIYSFFFVAMMRFLRLSALVAGLLTATLLVLSPTLEVIAKPLLGSSASYAPGLIATFGVALAVPLSGRGSNATAAGGGRHDFLRRFDLPDPRCAALRILERRHALHLASAQRRCAGIGAPVDRTTFTGGPGSLVVKSCADQVLTLLRTPRRGPRPQVILGHRRRRSAVCGLAYFAPLASDPRDIVQVSHEPREGVNAYSCFSPCERMRVGNTCRRYRAFPHSSLS